MKHNKQQKKPFILPVPLSKRVLQAARSELARIAGNVKSEAKADAARANGAKGGRPRVCPQCGLRMSWIESKHAACHDGIARRVYTCGMCGPDVRQDVRIRK
jgi:DNA-directed RNA polymerase subunit RPC12/RpoP